MAKNKVNLDADLTKSADLTPVVSSPKTEKSNDKKPSGPAKPKRKSRLAKVFREMISELKKVEWPPFTKTKNHRGVLSQTGSVMIVVLFFLIVIFAFDSGLLALLKLLTKAQ